MGILSKLAFIPKLLNNPVASSSLINLAFLFPHATQFYKSIGFLFFVFATLRFLLSVFILCFKQYDNIVM